MFSVRKIKAGLFFSCLYLFTTLMAQINYVRNPSFENAPNLSHTLTLDYIWAAPPWDSLKAGDWGLFTTALVARSPSVNMGGYQIARTGSLMSVSNQYFGIIDRRYIQQELLKPLINNKSYCVSAYFNLSNRSQYAMDRLSIYFDDGTIKTSGPGQPAIVTPQIVSPIGIYYKDTLGWEKVQGSFTATGSETFITIGNFFQQASLTPSLVYPGAVCACADYFLDDVSVIESDLPAYAGRDTVLCTGDSVFIGRPPEIGLECIWNSNGSQIGSGGGLWVKPSTTQTFEVTQDVCGLIKKDTIRVQIKPKYNGPPINLTVSSPTTCADKTISLAIQNNPPVLNGYNWLPLGAYVLTNNISASAVVSLSTTFTLNINNLGQDAFCPFQRTASVSVSAPVFTDSPSLAVDVNPICPGDTFNISVMNPAPGNTVTYQWLPASAYSFTNNLSAKSITQLGDTYSLNINSSGNASICAFSRSLSISVSVADSCFKDPVIPNIFTPNNDNSNDQWSIKFPYGSTLSVVEVYDRWGKLIYRREDLNFNKQGYANIGWDGRNTSGEEMSAGVYFYVLQYTDKQGVKKSEKGNITLLR